METNNLEAVSGRKSRRVERREGTKSKQGRKKYRKGRWEAEAGDQEVRSLRPAWPSTETLVEKLHLY